MQKYTFPKIFRMQKYIFLFFFGIVFYQLKKVVTEKLSLIDTFTVKFLYTAVKKLYIFYKGDFYK